MHVKRLRQQRPQHVAIVEQAEIRTADRTRRQFGLVQLSSLARIVVVLGHDVLRGAVHRDDIRAMRNDRADVLDHADLVADRERVGRSDVENGVARRRTAIADDRAVLEEDERGVKCRAAHLDVGLIRADRSEQHGRSQCGDRLFRRRLGRIVAAQLLGDGDVLGRGQRLRQLHPDIGRSGESAAERRRRVDRDIRGCEVGAGIDAVDGERVVADHRRHEFRADHRHRVAHDGRRRGSVAGLSFARRLRGGDLMAGGERRGADRTPVAAPKVRRRSRPERRMRRFIRDLHGDPGKKAVHRHNAPARVDVRIDGRLRQDFRHVVDDRRSRRRADHAVDGLRRGDLVADLQLL